MIRHLCTHAAAFLIETIIKINRKTASCGYHVLLNLLCLFSIRIIEIGSNPAVLNRSNNLKIVIHSIISRYIMASNEQPVQFTTERSCSCACLCIKKERTCTLTVLGALQIFISFGSLAVGNWAVFSLPIHLRKTAAFSFWSGGTVSILYLKYYLSLT